MDRLQRSKGLVRLFVFGAIAGAFFDGFHTYGGMTAYPNPIALRMAWWTMPLFGGAYVLLALTYGALRRAGDGDHVPSATRAWIGFAIFGLVYFATGFLPAGHTAKLALLLGTFSLLITFVDRSRAGWMTGLIAALAGPAFEIALVHLGAFAHLEPDIAGVPIWLPGLYLVSGPGLAPLTFRIAFTSR